MKNEEIRAFFILIIIIGIISLIYIILSQKDKYMKEVEDTCNQNNMAISGYYCVDTDTGIVYSPKFIKKEVTSDGN